MDEKKELISGIIFGIYFTIMLMFIPMVFFYGQIIGGSIYFVCFALTLAYFIIDLKYEFAFKKFLSKIRQLYILIFFQFSIINQYMGVFN